MRQGHKRAVSSFMTNGNFKLGSNIPEQKKLDETHRWLQAFPIYPIVKYPPNPLGLYIDMGPRENGVMIGIQLIIIPTPIYDPQGPVKGNEKSSYAVFMRINVML